MPAIMRLMLQNILGLVLSLTVVKTLSNWTCGLACQTLTQYQVYFTQQFDVSTVESLAFTLLINPSTKRFVTSFRGSIGTVELIMEALQRKGVSYNLTNIPGALIDEYFYTHYVSYLRQEFSNQIKAAYAKYPDYQYIFTGHSLGAAFAVLGAFDAVNQGIVPGNKVIVYNYGMPRLGNFILAQAIEATLKEIYRVVHWRDLVPHLPFCMKDASGNCAKNSTKTDVEELPGAWPAWHVTTEIWYNKNFTSYTACGGEGEDPKCSNQFNLTQTSIPNHLHYFGVFMDCPKAKQEDLFFGDSERVFLGF